MAEPQTERQKQLAARQAKIAATIPQTPRVRVNPASDSLRGALVHPSGIKFPEHGSVEWPLDSFTKRRIADGSVTREDDQQRSQSTRAVRPAPSTKVD